MGATALAASAATAVADGTPKNSQPRQRRRVRDGSSDGGSVGGSVGGGVGGSSSSAGGWRRWRERGATARLWGQGTHCARRRRGARPAWALRAFASGPSSVVARVQPLRARVCRAYRVSAAASVPLAYAPPAPGGAGSAARAAAAAPPSRALAAARVRVCPSLLRRLAPAAPCSRLSAHGAAATAVLSRSARSRLPLAPPSSGASRSVLAPTPIAPTLPLPRTSRLCPRGRGYLASVALKKHKKWRWRWRCRCRCRCPLFLLSLPRAWGVSLCCAVRPLAVVVRWALAGSQRPHGRQCRPRSPPLVCLT